MNNKMEVNFNKIIQNLTISFKKNLNKNGLYYQPYKCQTYQKAVKAAQGKNYIKALKYLVEAAEKSNKYEACVREFAIILHKIGYTKQSVEFLEELEKIHSLRDNRYHRLITNLQVEVVKAKKKHHQFVLLDIRNIQKQDVQIIPKFLGQIFESPFKIRDYALANTLGFTKFNIKGSRYLVISFNSFQAAKETVQSFNYAQWFTIEKYWLNLNFEIVCEITNGPDEFEKIKKLKKSKANMKFRSLQEHNQYMVQKLNNIRLAEQQTTIA